MSEEFVRAAKSQLLRFSMDIDPTEPAAHILLHVLHMIGIIETPEEGYEPFRAIFEAFTSRWFKLNNTVLQQFRDLINRSEILEI